MRLSVYELEEHEKNATSQLDESITIRKQIVDKRERAHNRRSNDR